MSRPTLKASISYDVPCRCGRLLHGQRQPTGQLVPCPHCGRKHFVFPSSAWLPPRAASAPEPVRRLNFRRFLIVLIVGGALAMGLIFLFVRPFLHRATTTTDGSMESDRRALLEAGERQLREGNVHLALKELNAALVPLDRKGETLSRDEQQRWEQLRRETDLLAHLLDLPLEDILHHAMQHRNEEEWRAKFEEYRGRTVVFDDVLRRDARGWPTLGVYVVRVGEVEMRIALEDLTLLRQLALDPPCRCLFGARLASCRREQAGLWVLRFEPDSAVLFTDEIAASVCCPLPLDEELLAVLKRQKERLRK